MKYKKIEISFLLITILCICDISNLSIKKGILKIIKVNQKQNYDNFSILEKNFEQNVDFFEISNRNNLEKSKRKIIIKGSLKKNKLIDGLDELPPAMLNEDKYIAPEYVESLNDIYHDVKLNSPDLLKIEPINANKEINLLKSTAIPNKSIIDSKKVQAFDNKIKNYKIKSMIVNPLDQQIINQMNNKKSAVVEKNKIKATNIPVAKKNLVNLVNVNQKLNVVKTNVPVNNKKNNQVLNNIINHLNSTNKANGLSSNTLITTPNSIVNTKLNDNFANKNINTPALGGISTIQNKKNEEQLIQALQTLRAKLPYKINTNAAKKENVPIINKLSPSVINSPQKKKITDNSKLINPAPSPIIISKPISTPITQPKSNLIQNPIYPILNSKTLTKLVLPAKILRVVIPPIVNEKKDADIQELLKGHKNVVENETKIIKIGRKKKKSLKSFLSPLQIAAYNNYNPTPDKIERITHRTGNLTPSPVHHTKNHPANFNKNQYNQQIKAQQINVANSIETAKILSIVQNEIDTKKKIKKIKKLNKKKAKMILKKKLVKKVKKNKNQDLKKKDVARIKNLAIKKIKNKKKNKKNKKKSDIIKKMKDKIDKAF